MRYILKYIMVICFLLFNISNVLHAAVPLKVTIEVRLATSSGGFLTNGSYDVNICIIESFSGSCSGKMMAFKNVNIVNGYASFVLGEGDNQISASHFDVLDPHFLLTVKTKTNADDLSIRFPIPSTPYAVHAHIADYAHTILADQIEGDFGSIAVKGELRVGELDDITFYVSTMNRNVGIGKKPSDNFTLDVNGSIRASNYLIDGQEFEEKFAWQKNDEHLFYEKGNVGIGKEPSDNFTLDVSGNINAEAFFVDGKSLMSELNSTAVWFPGNNGSIYWKDFSLRNDFSKVGIGVSQNLQEALEVSGAIRIGKSQSITPKSGTIEYDSQARNNQGDFIAWINNKPYSLIGVVFNDLEDGQLLRWNHSLEVSGVPTRDFIVTDEGLVGIGISEPNAMLTIKGKENLDVNLLDIRTKEDQSAFVVDQNGHVGILTTPTTSYAMDVNGILNAEDIYIKGEPLDKVIITDTFWKKNTTKEDNESIERLYYDKGYVGIGTSQPSNLLEIANLTASGDAAITFSHEGVDKFTMGVSRFPIEIANCDENENESFIISTGTNLKDPVFSFKPKKTGIGTDCPKARFHVQGDGGFLVSGEFNEGDSSYKKTLNNLVSNLSQPMMFFVPSIAAFRSGSFFNSNFDDIGKYSVVFGVNNLASGTGAVVAGGEGNRAEGNYSTVLGGQYNHAKGEGSVAMGRYASADHAGTFVWNSSNYFTEDEQFRSLYNGQFLINAYGGVGIGTADTSKSSLTVKVRSEDDNEFIVSFMNHQTPEDSFRVTKKGLVGIGLENDVFQRLEDDNSIKLAVNGKVNIGGVCSGCSESSAQLVVRHEGDSAYAMSVYNSNNSTSNFVIDKNGNVGIGNSNPHYLLDVSGNISAKQFIVIDDKGKEFILNPSGGSVWSSDVNDDIYRIMGNVGIGTNAPESLLTLSNQLGGAAPELTFESKGTVSEYFTMGVITHNATFMIQNKPSLNMNDVTALLVTQNRIGVSMSGNEVPAAAFHVNGSAIISEKLAIGTTDFQGYALNVNGIMSVTSLNINNKPVDPKDSPWISGGGVNDKYIYVSKNYQTVLIGSDSIPSQLSRSIPYALVVSGDVYMSNLTVSKSIFVRENLQVEQVSFRDSQCTNGSCVLSVLNGALNFNGQELSSNLNGDQTIEGSGPLAFWSNQNTIGKLPLFWNSYSDTLALTGNMNISSYSNEKGYLVTSNVKIGNLSDSSNTDSAFIVNVQLDDVGEYFGNPDDKVSRYSLHKIQLDLNDNWGMKDENNKLIGLDINMRSSGTSQLLNDAHAVGLKVEVPTQSIAALFLGGRVGIGTETPLSDVALDVNGYIKAKSINIDRGLKLDGEFIVIDQNENIAFKVIKTDKGFPRVGIGRDNLEDSEFSLMVSGSIQADNAILTGGIKSVTMNINDSLYVDSQGHVGIGAAPVTNSLVLVYNEINENLSNDFISEKIDVKFNFSDDPNSSYNFDNDFTGLQLDISSGLGSVVWSNKRLVGLDINITANGELQQSRIVGLDVDISQGVSTDESKRYAAIFQGGSVLIGKSPDDDNGYALEVSGNINADFIAFDNLDVLNLDVFELTAQSASVNTIRVDTLKAKNIFYENLRGAGKLDIESTQIVTLNATYVIAEDLDVQNPLSLDFLNVKDVLSVSSIVKDDGQILTINASNVIVDGDFEANDATILNKLTFIRHKIDKPLLDNKGLLYVDQNGELRYVDEKITPDDINNNQDEGFGVNLTKYYTGIPGNVAMTNEDREFITSPMNWDADKKTLKIEDVLVETNVTFNKGVTNLVAEKIQLNIASGQSASESRVFKGLDINLTSLESSFLGENEVAVGLNVDFRAIQSLVTTNLKTAIFMGGNVGIGISEPQAKLHIKKENKESMLFLISNDQGNVFEVDSQGNTAIGGSIASDYKLFVAGDIKIGKASSTTNNFVVKEGKVGIGIDNPTYSLHVSQNMNVADYFVVTKGKVGIGTVSPSHSFHVVGDSKLADLTLESLTVNQETVFFQGVMVSKNIGSATTQSNIYGSTIELSLAENLSDLSSIRGLDINIGSRECAPGLDCHLVEGSVYGLYVDVIGPDFVNSRVSRNAAVFMGGNVGIGIDTPKYPLHVFANLASQGNSGGDRGSALAGFSYKPLQVGEEITLTIEAIQKDSDSLIGFNINENSDTSALAFSNSQVFVNYNTDISLDDFSDAKLLVNGDVQIGLKEGAEMGNKLIFGGCTDYTCPNIHSFNSGTQGSGLRVVIPTSTIGLNRFEVGSEKDAEYKPSFFVNQKGLVGIVPDGINDTDYKASFEDRKMSFYVQSYEDAGSEPVVVIKNQNTDSDTTSRTLGLHFNSNSATTNHDFITFTAGTELNPTLLGVIEGNQEGKGVRFKTGGADYAEYLEKIDTSEVIERGDIVGVFNGKISKSTIGAQQFMVRSSGAAVAGNWPGEDQLNYELISFFGQVYVKVIGRVESGDFIIPSGRHDGTGIAVSIDELTLDQKQIIVGRAWAESSDEEEKLILCAVGLNFSLAGFDQEMVAIESLRNAVNRLSDENRELATQLDLIKLQDKKIDALIDRLE